MLPDRIDQFKGKIFSHWLDVVVAVSIMAIVSVFIVSMVRSEKIVGISLEGEWKVNRQNGFDFFRKEFDDSSWRPIILPDRHLMPSETISVPLATESYGPFISKVRGYAWYRKNISIEYLPTGPLLLQIREIMNADRIYVNGVLVGETGRFPPNFKSGWAKLRSYKIPEGLLVRGSNTIAIQVYFDSEAWIMGPMEIVDYSYGSSRAMWSSLLVNNGMEAFSLTLVFISAFFMFLYVLRKQELNALFFSLACITMSITISLQYIENNYTDITISSNTILRFTQSGLLSFPCFLSMFFWQYTRGRIGRIRTFLTLAVPCVGIFLLWTVPDRQNILSVRAFFSIGIAYFIIEIFSLTMLDIIKGKRHGIEIFIAMLPLLVLSFHDVLVFSFRMGDSGISLFMYGLPLLIVVMGGQILRRFARNLDEIEMKSDLLEKYSMELESKNFSLERLDRMKNEFLANTSHELRTPLTGIIGIAESLVDGTAGKLPEAANRNLALIISSGKRLSSLVNDLIDYSKMKYDGIEINLKPVDIYYSADLVISLSRILVGNKKLEIKNNISSKFPKIMADENRLQQILYNLIGNSIKFTESGSIEVSASFGEFFAEISVKDTGIGIQKDKHNEIFQSFEQLDSSVTRQYGGTGLGLPISKKLVEMHGGKIRIESDKGEGAVFAFTIPLARGDDYNIEDAGNAADKDILSAAIPFFQGIIPRSDLPLKDGCPKILVVDDEPINIQVLYNHLSNAGYEIVAAMSGAEALKSLDAFTPDLVILDLMMPVMSGYEVCQKIRCKYSMYDLPILLLTAKTQVSDIVSGFESGANDYLEKPFDKRELLARAESLIALRIGVREHKKLLVLEHELDIAMRIQKAIIPDKLPDIPGISMHAYYKAMREVGGDIYDFITDGETRLGILVGDVSGHGIPASIISAMVKIAFSFHKEYIDNPKEMLSRMNSALRDKCERHFVTAGYAFIDFAASTLVYSSAGHLPILVWKKNERRIVKLKPKGRVLGLFNDVEFLNATLALSAGDRIFLITDGVLECRNSENVLFGEERFDEAIEKYEKLAPNSFIETVLKDLGIWMNGNDFEDDVEMIVVDINGVTGK